MGLKSYIRLDMAHDGLLSTWERHAPTGKYHIFFKRAFKSEGHILGMYSYPTAQARDKVAMKLAAAWELTWDPAGLVNAKKTLETYHAWRHGEGFAEVEPS